MRPGFALVITLALMVLLAILAVGLLSLSSVALRSSSHGKAQAEARANARMGLMLALGQLQELAGEDRRVTATADLGMDAASTHGSRYWTGVWSNMSAAAADEIYTRTPKAKFEGWLVSGEKEDLLDPDSTTISLGNGVKLVGEGTAGILATEHVTVPLVEVEKGAGKMAGRYGWWVGDEGVKSRGNLPSKGNPTAAATDLTLGARGGGWETVTGMESYPARGAVDEATLERLITLPTTSVAIPSVRATALQHFHSISIDSRGLLTDTLTGGLRLDLTPYLENGFPTTPASAALPNAPVTGANILPYTLAPDIKGPTWDRLRSLRTMRPPAGGKLTVAVGNGGDQALIAPILLDVRLLMGAKLVPVPGNVTEYRIYPCGKIAVALANPYPYPLRWTRDLELEVFRSGGAGSRIWDAANRPMYLPDSSTGASVFGNAIFTIPAGELAPGEAQAYTMTGQVNRPMNAKPISVPLGSYLSQGPTDYRKSIVMEHSGTNTGNKLLDVREPTNTAVIAIELRASGSGTGAGILRRLEAFELDNAFFSQVRRQVNATVAKQMTEPFPLQLYSFQMSQPGMDYGSLLPAASQLGVRNSTLRTFADFNIRAQRFPRPIAGYLTPPYFMESSDNLASLPFNKPGGDTGTGFTRNLALSPLRWGHSPVSGPRKTILFAAPDEIVSLAQLQHADLTADDRFASVSVQPGNALGNSYAPPFIKRGLSLEIRYDYIVNSLNSATGTANRYYDMSYLLNAALWDSFFISSVPPSGAAAPINPRITEILPGTPPAELRDPLRVASHLWVEGGFNVNSTRKDAWKALLASNRKLKHPAETNAPSEGAMFPRSLAQTGQPQLPKPSGDGDDSLNGFRRLNDAQLDTLAAEIARQVRLRGPFVSLSHFVNRALVNLTDDDDKLGRSGALQSAIDDSGLNMSPGNVSTGFTNLSPANNLVRMQRHADGRPEADMVGTTRKTGLSNHASDRSPPVWTSESRDGNPGNTGSILSDRLMLTDAKYRPEQGFRSTGIPGWLTQADVLQVIGPVISARSDTFRIRSYGEALDAAGNTVARAWCEAIVQRTPEFVDATNSPETRPANLNTTNAKFGRRFAVVSFRWLHPDEI